MRLGVEHVTMRNTILLSGLSCAMAACSFAPPQAGQMADAGVKADAGVVKIDAGDEPDAGEEFDAGEWVDAGPQPLAGDAPFSRVLAGSADLYGEDGGFFESRSLAVQAYFPEGMHSNAPLLLSVLPSDNERLFVSSPFQGVLDDQLGVGAIETVFQRAGYDRLEDAVLDSSAGSLTGNYTLCTNCGGDSGFDFWKGTAVLRNYGQETPLGRIAQTKIPVPISRIGVVSSVPLSTASQVKLLVQAGNKQIEGSVSVSLTGFSWAPTTAQVLPPNTTVSFTGTGLKDVVGRDVPIDLQFDQKRTTAVLTDLSLQSPPPSGALVEFSLTADQQRLSIGSDSWFYEVRSGMVSLGRPAGKTSLRVRLVQNCRTQALARAALVAADGASTELFISCDEASLPTSVPLPGTGPVWLVVDDLPPSAADLSVYVDSLAFE
jgi:hypothetical protein